MSISDNNNFTTLFFIQYFVSNNIGLIHMPMLSNDEARLCSYRGIDTRLGTLKYYVNHGTLYPALTSSWFKKFVV